MQSAAGPQGLGLGTVLTTLHRRHEDDIKELLGIPENVETATLIPMGYPAEGKRFRVSRRKRLEKVTFYDRWGWEHRQPWL
jgi:nitroreductase